MVPVLHLPRRIWDNQPGVSAGGIQRQDEIEAQLGPDRSVAGRRVGWDKESLCFDGDSADSTLSCSMATEPVFLLLSWCSHHRLR